MTPALQRRHLNASDTELLKDQFDYYEHLLALEFKGLTAHEMYELSFSRLLKLSHFFLLDRDRTTVPTMIGNDERDRFVPALRQLASQLPERANVFDFGCGDGLTLSLALSAFPKSTIIGFEDPNPSYLEQYEALLASRGFDAAAGFRRQATFDEMVRADAPAAGSQHLCLAMHMLYFVDDISGALNFMIDRLRPGGTLFVTLASSLDAFTGKSLLNYVELADPIEAKKIRTRQKDESGAFALKNKDDETRDISASLQRKLKRADIEATGVLQDTHLFGNDLGDLFALAFLTGLAEFPEGSVEKKIRSVRTLIERQPEQVALAVELTGQRSGMLSVSEPQMVVEIRRLAGDAGA